MKKILFVILALLVLTSSAGAAQQVSASMDASKEGVRIITFQWSASNTAGVVTFTTDDFKYNAQPLTTWIKGYYLYTAESVPGTPAPAINYFVEVHDSANANLTGNLMATLSNTNAQLANFGNTTAGYPLVGGQLRINLYYGNASAQGGLILTFVQ
jgi:hypothetical protein